MAKSYWCFPLMMYDVSVYYIVEELMWLNSLTKLEIWGITCINNEVQNALVDLLYFLLKW